MSKELQPPVLLVSLVKLELPTVIKNEPPESEIVEIGIDDILDSSEESKEEIIPDVKDIDIVYHPVCEEAIKTEILESYHCESVESQVLVETENSPVIQADKITQRNKTGDTSDENVSKSTGQAVVEVQASNEHSNALSDLESVRSRKSKSPKKTDFAECYNTDDTTLWKKEKEKIKVIKAPVIPVESHEYISLAKDKHVCNYCQYVCNRLHSLKKHIEKIHREVTTMYWCPYCLYKSKWSLCGIKNHIIRKHKDTKDIQWFQCNLCETKFKLKGSLTQHMKVHLRDKQMKDKLDLREKSHHCDTCSYKTYRLDALRRHNLIHLKPEKIEYFYCYHCSYKSKQKVHLKQHIFIHHFKHVEQGKRHQCDKCDYKTYASTALKNHKLSHLKPEEIQYFYCYHCSYQSKQKMHVKRHILTHNFNDVKQRKRYHCNKCNYRTHRIGDLNRHKLNHLKPEDIPYFHCYHCSYKAKWKGHIKKHIFIHFKKEQVKFDCYICNFMTQKRKSITEHIKKHSKVQIKFEINEGS